MRRRVHKDETDARTGLAWSDRLGNTIDYDATGRILDYANHNGVAVTFNRDGAGASRASPTTQAHSTRS